MKDTNHRPWRHRCMGYFSIAAFFMTLLFLANTSSGAEPWTGELELPPIKVEIRAISDEQLQAAVSHRRRQDMASPQYSQRSLSQWETRVKQP